MGCVGSGFIGRFIRMSELVSGDAGCRVESSQVGIQISREWLDMSRQRKRVAGGTRKPGPRTDLTPEFRDAVTTRAMQLRLESHTLRETVAIVNEEFGDSLAFETIRKWIQDRIKPELEETVDAYRQNLLEQIALQKRRLEPKMLMGDEKAVGRSEEHTSELQSLMRSSYAVFCLKKKNQLKNYRHNYMRYLST